MNIPAVKLSCEQCQRRKTKCDKSVPCSACVRAELVCTAVQRHRLPRGRGAKSKQANSALKDRIERLETIISKLQRKESAAVQTSVCVHYDARRALLIYIKEHMRAVEVEAPSVPPKTVESFVAPSFWAELTDAIAGLRGVLEEDYTGPTDVEDPVLMTLTDSSPSSNPSKNSPADPHAFIFDSGSSLTEIQHNFSLGTSHYLLRVYQERVDTIFKVVHLPTSLKLIQDNSLRAKPSVEVKALEYAMMFTASCSVFDHELDQRQALREQYQQATEEAFTSAGLLTTMSLTLLQAFVIYLVSSHGTQTPCEYTTTNVREAGLRACRANAQQWTLTAIAIRSANAQGIPLQSFTQDRTPDLVTQQILLDVEQRRRLWFCIGILDMQSAFDRGSKPLLGSDDFQTWPMNIDDSELLQHPLPSASQSRNSFTDMSFSMIVYRAMICQRKLTEIGRSAEPGDLTVDRIAAGYEQISVLADFERHVRQLAALRNASSSPSAIQRFTVAVAEESLVAMRLLLHRPLHRRGNSYIPAEYGPNQIIDILTTATEVLESSLLKRASTEFMKWAWFSWVKWYALAIVLAELLCTASGPLADRAWKAAQQCYENYAKFVADTKSGLLWEPIAKLMRKVKIMRQEQIAEPQKAVWLDAAPLPWLTGNGKATAAFEATSHQSYSNITTTPSLQSYDALPHHPQFQSSNAQIDYWDLFMDDINTSDIMYGDWDMTV